MKQHAQRYIDEGWAVVPLVARTKRARDSWQKKTFAATDFKDDDNVGGKCGEPSGWRVDVDCDAPEAIEAARLLLPHTGLVHGRPSKPDSHYWFICEGIKSAQFIDVKGADGKSGMLVEIRSTGGYTALPPSVHPSGETFAWSIERDPMIIADTDDLLAVVRDVALAALLARHWPPSGARHAMIGPLAGFLLQAGLSPTFVARIIRTAATVAADTDVEDRMNFVSSTCAAFQAGHPVTGGPTLADSLGADVVAKMRTWLEYRDENEAVLDPKDPMPSARLFVQRDHTVDGVLALRHQSEVFFRYDGVYRDWPEADVRAALYRFLEQAKRPTDKALLPFQPNRSKVENVLDALRGVTNLPSQYAAPCWIEGDAPCDPMALLPCRNGLLYLPSRTLLPLTPQFFVVNGLAFDYDEHAPSPTEWLAFLDSVWPTDPASIDTLQEIIGYVPPAEYEARYYEQAAVA